MAENDVLNNNSNLDDFDLPPLPKLPPKLKEGAAETASEPEIKASVSADGDFGLPPLKSPVPKAEKAEDKAEEEIAADNSADDDFELPPLKTPPPKEEETSADVEDDDDYADEVYDNEADSSESEEFDYDSEYDMDDLDKIDTDEIVLEDLTKSVAPIRTREEESARNIRENVRMNDLAMEMDGMPVLDDLSTEYAPPEKKAVSLVEKEKLEDDEKRILKQHLAEDLGKRPENFNARASQRMYDRLMEEKKLKTAKKGFGLSLIPIFLGLASAVIAYLKLGWGSYDWISYFAVFMVLAALLLFVKSKHTKLFSITIYALCLLLYVGVGLVLYVMNEQMMNSPDKIMHFIFVIAAAACNIISIIILQKNEAVNTYYSSSFKRK